MVHDKTTEQVLSDLRAEFELRHVLFMEPSEFSVRKLIYAYITSAVECDPDRKIIWVCLSITKANLLSDLEKYGFDLDSHKDNFWFIVPHLPSDDPEERTMYCSSSSDYTRMASHVSKLFSENPGSLLVLDDATPLGKDNLQVVENFLRYARKSASENKITVISMIKKGVLSTEGESMLKSVFDLVIDVQYNGLMHGETCLMNRDLRYSLDKGYVKLEYVRRKVAKDRIKILVVDDEPDIVELIKLSFARQPYDFIAAYSGEEAVEKAREELPDLILLDIMMPGMDGYEVVEQLKQIEDTREIPVIMVSAKTDVDDKVRGMELGIDDYISKPFDKREMNARIKMVMKRYGWTADEA
ncbi:response regulator receiver protein [Methanosalsum zhilinae DSM 4017]|uniref:Response regulator receiver protein n=1 Tax=Methanosalsum zhilinae (strain DSM 4017 / NBRC 107636 / OCM 62 / WeN5) TaxID=679901 RepID=F7XPY4_METZD|nr:response regulator [Methanosalsum zhilinae]AEH61506.1 response regulator receiver protein [Methanosalsum zhilinae DSM 4017]